MLIWMADNGETFKINILLCIDASLSSGNGSRIPQNINTMNPIEALFSPLCTDIYNKVSSVCLPSHIAFLCHTNLFSISILVPWSYY